MQIDAPIKGNNRKFSNDIGDILEDDLATETSEKDIENAQTEDYDYIPTLKDT